MRRASRLLALFAGALLLLPLVGVLGLETRPGQELARRAAETAGVRIAVLEGSPLRATTLHGVALADRDGTWLRIDRLDLAWSPLALLAGRLEIGSLRLVGLALDRLPAPEQAAEPGEAGMPRLPVGLVVREAALEDARIGAAIAGIDLRLDGSAHAALGRDLIGTAGFDLRDSTGGRYGARLRRDETVAVRLDISEPAHGLIARLAGLPGLGRLVAEATIEGSPVRAEVRLAVAFGAGLSATAEGVLGRDDATDLTFATEASTVALGALLPEGYGLARLAATGRLTGDIAATLRLVAEATAEGIALPADLPLPPLGAEPARLRLAATRDTAGAVTLERAELAHPLLGLAVTGHIAERTRLALEASLPRLAPFAEAARVPADGRAVLAARLEHGPAGTSVTGQLGLADAALPAPLDLLLGATPSADADLLFGPEGVVVRRVTLTGLAASLEVAGRAGASLDLDGTLHLPALTALAPSLAGEAELAFRLEGAAADPEAALRLAAPNLAIDGVGAGRLSLTAELQRLASAPSARLIGEGNLDGRPLALEGTAEPRADGTVAIRRLALRLGTAGLEADGQVLADGRPDLVATLSAPDLAELLPGLAGALSARITVGPGATDRVDATVEARAEGLALAGLAAREAALTGTARDVLGTPTVAAQLAARGLAAGGITGALDLAVAGTPAALDLDGRFNGPDLSASLAAQARLPEAVTVSALTVAARGETIRLVSPTTIRLGETVALGPTALALREGRIEARGRIAPDFDLHLAARRLPLALAALAVPGPAPSGTIDLDATLRGTATAPDASARLAVRGARLPEGPAAALPPAALDATLRAAGGRAQLGAQLRLGAAARLDLTAEAALDGSALRARLDGPIDLALADPLLTPAGRRARGRLAVALSADGPLAAPVLGGEVRLADGAFDDAALGFRLDGIAGRLAARGDTIVVDRLAARAGAGTVEVGGSIRPLAAGVPLELTLTARDASLALRGKASVEFSADLLLAGEALGALAATGRIAVARADLWLPERLPAEVVDLPVRIAGAPAPPPAPPAAPATVALDVAVDAPRAVFVRGRGVDAELGGAVRLGGTAAAPDLSGALGLRRGRIDILGQTIAFRRGALDFDGAAGIDPALDFEAATTAGNVTALVRVGGTASAPVITLASEPELPQDEVLARLLFGRSQATLTPAELLRLAQAAAELAGVGPAGPGVLDRVRRGLGLDRLAVGADPAGGGPTVEAGRYLADGVYLGARRAADGSARATVQIEVLPNVRVEADVGGEGESRVGLSWGIDY